MAEENVKSTESAQSSGDEQKPDFRIEENAFSNIDHIIGVVSGKAVSENLWLPHPSQTR